MVFAPHRLNAIIDPHTNAKPTVNLTLSLTIILTLNLHVKLAAFTGCDARTEKSRVNVLTNFNPATHCSQSQSLHSHTSMLTSDSTIYSIISNIAILRPYRGISLS